MLYAKNVVNVTKEIKYLNKTLANSQIGPIVLVFNNPFRITF